VARDVRQVGNRVSARQFDKVDKIATNLFAGFRNTEDLKKLTFLLMTGTSVFWML
jgi:hypothetical protein